MWCKMLNVTFTAETRKVYLTLCFYCAGESVDISDGDTESVALTSSSGQTLREKMVYMSVGDSHHNQGNHGESLRPNTWG